MNFAVRLSILLAIAGYYVSVRYVILHYVFGINAKNADRDTLLFSWLAAVPASLITLVLLGAASAFLFGF